MFVCKHLQLIIDRIQQKWFLTQYNSTVIASKCMEPAYYIGNGTSFANNPLHEKPAYDVEFDSQETKGIKKEMGSAVTA